MKVIVQDDAGTVILTFTDVGVAGPLVPDEVRKNTPVFITDALIGALDKWSGTPTGSGSQDI